MRPPLMVAPARATRLDSSSHLNNLSSLALWGVAFSVVLQSLYQYSSVASVGQGGNPGSLLYRSAAAIPVPFAALLAYLQGRMLIPSGWRRLFVGVVLVFVSSVVVGSVSGNSVRYVLGDSFRFAIPWLALFVALSSSLTLLKTGHSSTVNRVLSALAWFGVFDALVTLYLSMAFPGLRISTGFYVFTLVWSLFSRRWHPAFRVLSIGLCVIAIALAGKRGLLISAALAGVYFLALLLKSRRFRAHSLLLIPWLLVMCIGLVLVESRFLRDSVGYAGERLLDNAFNIATGENEDASFEARFDEGRNVLYYFEEAPVMIPLGAGFGAEVPMYLDTGVYSESGQMHHVHASWVAYFLRNGVIGVAVLACFFVLAMRTTRNSLNTQPADGDLLWVAIPFIAVQLLLSLKSNIMLELAAPPMIIGLLCGLAIHEQELARDVINK